MKEIDMIQDDFSEQQDINHLESVVFARIFLDLMEELKDLKEEIHVAIDVE